MVGPAQPPPSRSPTKSKPEEKETIKFNYPEWLVNMTINNSEKHGVPLDFLVKKVQEVADSGKANPWKRYRKRLDEENEKLEVIDEERDNRRHTKITRRKKSAAIIWVSRPSQIEDDELVVESSKAAAARNPSINNKSSKTANTTTANSPKDSLAEPPAAETSSSLFIPEDNTPDEHLPLGLPAWYTKIKNTDRRMKELGKRPSSSDTQALKALSSMKGYMERCEATPPPTRAQLNKLFEELRDQVHKAEITLKVDRYIVRKAKMMENEYGLARIFASTKVDFPWDLKADAWQLYLRWHEEIFEIDILRGIKARQGIDRNADSIDPSWKGKFSAKFYGEGHLVLGQWWPTQLTLVRDGAHGSAQGGIFGDKEKGAYSVVLSGAGNTQYHDEDNGSDIWYSGTDGKDFTPTENTLRLIETCDIVHNKVRVFRSHQLPKANPYRPVVGLRYDGLYEVVGKKLVDKEKQSYKFRLVRCKGQNPIRSDNNAARRPTRFEIMEDERLRKNGR